MGGNDLSGAAVRHFEEKRGEFLNRNEQQAAAGAKPAVTIEIAG